jgi:hypothetical protein
MTGNSDRETGMRNHGRGHSYKIDGVKVPGVTTIMSKGLPSTGLVKWAAECAADCAMDEWDKLTAMTPSERRKYLAKAPDRVRDAGGVQGTAVHKLAEAASHGVAVEVPETLTGYTEAAIAFLDDWHAQPVMSEFPVFSRKWMYAGCPDLLADVDRPEGAPPSAVLPEPDRWRVLIDWKTKKSPPFGTDALQLAGYRWAEFTLDGDGNEVPWAWAEGTESSGRALANVDECWIVWLRPDSYAVHPMETKHRVHKFLLYAKMITDLMDEARDWRLDAVPAPRRAATQLTGELASAEGART